MYNLSEEIKKTVIEIIEKKTNKTESIEKVSTLSGGSINDAVSIKCTDNKYFLKWNDAKRYPGMFEKEIVGLELLSSADQIFIPSPIGTGNTGNFSLLLLEFVESANQKNNFWEDFGEKLAIMHKKNTNQKFGLDHDNYIGSLQQYNNWLETWQDFFVTKRIEPQLEMARNSGLMNSSDVKKFESLYKKINDFFPVEEPSLLHGDLWSGNYMTDSRGEACIFDPAVYYGHRLMDIGMSRLFGGFSNSFYQAYHQTYPMENNWQEATEIANLYPLLVHVNLFGSGYAGSVRSVLRNF